MENSIFDVTNRLKGWKIQNKLSSGSCLLDLRQKSRIKSKYDSKRNLALLCVFTKIAWHIAKVNYLSLFAHICGRIKEMCTPYQQLLLYWFINQASRIYYRAVDMMGKVNAIYFSHHTISALFFQFLHLLWVLTRAN